MGAEFGKRAEEVGKTSGVRGFDIPAAFSTSPSLGSASPIGTVTSGTRYQFTFQGCLENDVNRPRAGYLPGPDGRQSEGRSQGLDQERGY